MPENILPTLTPRQREVFAAIVEFAATRGFTPGVSELSLLLGMSAPAVKRQLRRLAAAQAIKYVPCAMRGITLLKSPAETDTSNQK